jgi:hypothetical protein
MSKVYHVKLTRFNPYVEAVGYPFEEEENILWLADRGKFKWLREDRVWTESNLGFEIPKTTRPSRVVAIAELKANARSRDMFGRCCRRYWWAEPLDETVCPADAVLTESIVAGQPSKRVNPGNAGHDDDSVASEALKAFVP